jgi:hypothetical protein
MSWDAIGKPFSTADMSATLPVIYQPFKTTSELNQILRTVVAGLLFYNQPAFGTVALEIWSDNQGVPGRLLATSDSFTQAECNFNSFAYRIMGFTFSPGVVLKRNVMYHLTVRASAYTGDATSHIAWRQSFPDPQYTTGLTLTLEYGAKLPFDAAFETADL